MKTSVLILSIIMMASVQAATSSKCPGEAGYNFTNYARRNNPSAGGFVSNTAFVNDQDDDLFIAPSAAICGFASIEGRASIRGNTLIRGNTVVTDSAVVQGNIIIEGDSIIS